MEALRNGYYRGCTGSEIQTQGVATLGNVWSDIPGQANPTNIAATVRRSLRTPQESWNIEKKDPRSIKDTHERLLIKAGEYLTVPARWGRACGSLWYVLYLSDILSDSKYSSRQCGRTRSTTIAGVTIVSVITPVCVITLTEAALACLYACLLEIDLS